MRASDAAEAFFLESFSFLEFFSETQTAVCPRGKRTMKKCLAVMLFAMLATGAFAETRRHRAVRPSPAVVPTSEELIARALAAGTITAEQALTYRVFASFGDCRLPAQFRGDDSEMDTTFALDEVVATFNTLSPAAQTILRPYLREPYDSGGWVETQQAACGSGKTAPVDTRLKDITISGGEVVIKFSSGEESTANRIANDVTTIYAALTKLMTPHKPLGYDPTGKDPTRLRIWIFGGKQKFLAQAQPLIDSNLVTCQAGPAFIQIGPSVTKETLAEMIMFAILLGYPVATECKYPEYEWLIMATAAWAVDYVYHDSNYEHRWAEAFLKKPELTLENPDTVHAKGAYLLLFFVTYGLDRAFVPNVWNAAKTKLSLDAVEDALGPYGGFKKQWPEFALHNWNIEPYNDYFKWDRLGESAITNGFILFVAIPDGKAEVEGHDSRGSLAIAPLSAQYFDYFIKDNVRSLTFVNGLNFKLGLREHVDVPDFGKLYVLNNASKRPQGLKIQALLNINGVWEKTPRDWTDRPYVGFCREIPSEHVDEIVLIISNSNYKERRPMQPEGMLPLFWSSNIGCAKWKTTEASFEETDDRVPLKMNWSATFTGEPYDPGAVSDLPDNGAPILYTKFSGTGTVTWNVNGSAGGCSFSGGGELPLDPLATGLLIFTVAPPEALAYRGWEGLMGATRFIHYLKRCGDVTEKVDDALPAFVVVFPAEIKKVDPDGLTIRGNSAIGLDDKGKVRWTIKSSPP
jgi:hypothetical protein